MNTWYSLQARELIATGMAGQGPAGQMGARRKCTGRGSRDTWPRKSTGLLSGCAGMGAGKPRHGWN